MERHQSLAQLLEAFELLQQDERDERVTVPKTNLQDYDLECYQAFQKFYSNSAIRPLTIEDYDKIDPSEQDYYVLNRDSQLLVDTRQADQLEELTQVKFDEEKAWRSFWYFSILSISIYRNHTKQLNEELFYATEKGNIGKVLNLVKMRENSFYVDVNTKGLDDWTSLHVACNEKYLEIIEILLQYGANPNAKTQFQRTPLHLCALRNNIEGAKLLINSKASLNEQDSEFNTPLHLASQYAHIQMLELFLQHKADPFLRNFQNLNAIEVMQNGDVLNCFRSYGFQEPDQVFRICFSKILLDFLYKVSISWYLDSPTQQQIGPCLKINVVGLKKVHWGIYKFNSRAMDDEKLHEKQLKGEKEEEIIKNRKKNWFKSALNFTRISINNFFSKKDIDQTNRSTLSEDKVGPRSFQFYQMIGSGAFGDVYMVEKHDQPGQIYAMKIMKKDKLINQNLMKYVQTEKDVLKIMSHPFIVKLNYAFQTDKNLFLVMDFCPGGDLSTLLDIKRRIKEPVVKIYAAELLLALEALHQNGIIFRDLKPENVVLDEDGHAMLTDFGLSKQGVTDGELNNSFCGSPAYLAPEMLLRRGHNRQVDWYLLGVLIYELLVGFPPYFDHEKEILFENIKSGPLKVPKFITNDCKDLIIKV